MQPDKLKRFAGALAFALLGAGLGGVMTTPALAHREKGEKHGHLVSVIAKAGFLTRVMADGLYVPRGPLVLKENGTWQGTSFEGDVPTRGRLGTETRFTSDGTAFLSLSIPLLTPAAVGGIPYGLDRIRLCFRTESLGGGPDTINLLWVQDSGDVAPATTLPKDELSHFGEPRTCIVYDPGAPYVPLGTLTLLIKYNNDHTSDVLHLYGTTTTWVPV